MTTTKLPDFEGVPVRKATLRVAKAGDGLSEALSLEPVALHHGDRVRLVIEGVVTKVEHRPNSKVEDGEVLDLIRMHTIDAVDVALVDEDDVGALLERNRQRIETLARQRERDEQRDREAEAGEMRLPGADPAADLLDEHDAGGHAKGLVEGCAECSAEAEAAKAGD